MNLDKTFNEVQTRLMISVGREDIEEMLALRKTSKLVLHNANFFIVLHLKEKNFGLKTSLFYHYHAVSF